MERKRESIIVLMNLNIKKKFILLKYKINYLVFD